MVLLRRVILSASVAAFAVFSNAAPTPSVGSEPSPSVTIEPSPTITVEPSPPTTDPVPDPTPDPTPEPTDACAVLAQAKPSEYRYQHVVDCYNSIPFDSAQAASTISTMITLFKDYYVFTDAALARKAPMPFADDPHDVVGELEKVGRSKYTSDYKFHTDVLAAVDGLRDGHAAYNINCYQAYVFTQSLTLYAPVIRVFVDNAKRGYEDCTVESINGQDALAHLRTYARDVYGTSHDPNARLNFILASQSYDKDSSAYTFAPGDYSQRVTVPKSPFVEYQLKCPNATKTIHLKEEWGILPNTAAAFEDVPSYVANVCLAQSEPVQPPQEESNFVRRRIDPVRQITKRADPEPSPVEPGHQFPGAEQLVAGNATIFFHLKDRPETGVLVVHTFDAQEGEKDVVIEGLNAFYSRNVTNILIDFQGNPGGSIDFSAFLVQALFPNKHPLDAAFPSDMRISKSLQELAKLTFTNPEFGYFNARDFINFSSENGTARYENNDLFNKPITLNRNDRRNLWTEKTTPSFPPVSAEHNAAIATFPWTAKADNIRILTDGRCGSACGMASYFWTALHNVAAYAIGGTSGEDLSMFSFAGASVLKLKELQSFYKAANLTSPMADLPYENSVTFSWLEMYGKGRDTPFEYDAELYRPKHRLDFSPENARSREVLWKEVAAAAWK
ncbi:hypothetical protein BGX24_004392 [Mortierella sp. AD032]|nr:hypothetical protein BGX24_004392 [Mortierella sp. AD032]